MYSHKIDLNRWKETTSIAINGWFDTFNEVMDEYSFKLQNIYNMDETGFAIGSSQYSRVVVDITLQTWYKAKPGH